MNKVSSPDSDRQAGADAISAWAVEIALAHGVVLVKCEWDLGEDFSHQHAHRLDLFTDSKSVRLYFPDLELMQPQHEARKHKTHDRLVSAIAQLKTVPPSPTYSFS
jgi:hypothetical protein